jgi:hypothetical protein
MMLAGVPGGLGWLIFAMLLGAIFMGAFGWMCVHHWQSGGFGLPVVMTGLGSGLGGLFFVFGALSMAFGRETLTLDLAAGEGRYWNRSPIIDLPKPFTFALEHVQRVSVEQSTERSGGGGMRAGMSEHDVCRARLLIAKPRRAVTLDETSNGRNRRVRKIAQEVAEFLDADLAEVDRRRDS